MNFKGMKVTICEASAFCSIWNKIHMYIQMTLYDK